ncbi:MAG TPA: AAA family ATPase [Gemmatimonadaceae bacterium]|nr:AAA family ATPase [Gemmatimonadaceae bacterium]
MPSGPRSALPSNARLTLVTLGAAHLRADASTPLFDLGKPLALIAYLACAPERSVAREHFIDLLWGDVEPEAAKHALRQTLWYIRKRLGDRLLISGGDVLTLVRDIELDREAFLDAVTHGDAELVVKLYTGDFFPGFAAPGGAEFERWADIERQRLRSFFWLSAETLVRRWMSAGRLRDAQALARRVRDSDVLREGGWRLLFETLIAGGDTINGALEADAFDRLVIAEGTAPEPATRALLRTVRQSPLPSTTHQSDRPSFAAELVGREQEFSQLLASWESARSGRVTHVHVLAAAGLGKTRLLTDVSARLRATRARTVFVRASLGARDIPFGLAGDLAEALARLSGASGISTGSARALVSLNPALSAAYPAAMPDASGDAADALRRRTMAVRELISAVAEEQPIAIFIDDLQWADSRSRQLVSSVLGTLENARVLIVTAARPSIDAVTLGDRSASIRLTPLDATSVAALVSSIAALPAEPWAERLPVELCVATGGSPLMIVETLQHAIEGGMLERGESGWHSAKPARLFAAMGTGGALRQRIERLDRVELWVMTLLSVAGVPLSQDAVAAAAGRSHDDLVQALGTLERRGLIVRDEQSWMPSHDEIAAMTVGLATPDARTAAARALGRVILDRGPTDLRALRQAGALLAQSGDTEALGAAFSRFAHLSREIGDRQPNRALAADFLGERSTPSLIGGALRSLPLLKRLGLYSAQRQSALVAAIALVPLGVITNAFIVRKPAPDVEIAIGTVSADSVAKLYHVPVRAADLTPGSIIEVKPGFRPDWRLQADPSQGTIAWNARRSSWSVDRVASDSGGSEIFEVADNGRERRLTQAPGDDQNGTWSPDGRYIAYLTARWSTASRYDIAVQDVETGEVRRLTSGDESDTAPYWSPDGSRIAFARFYWTGPRRRETCVVAVDASAPRCFASSAAEFAPIGGWYDTDHVIVQSISGSRMAIGRLNVSSGALDTVTVLTTGSIWVSPDGHWVACGCRRTGFSASAILLFPMDEPNRVVELDVRRLPAGRRILLGWTSSRHTTRWVDHLTIDPGPGAPLVGIPHGLRARGVALDGEEVGVGPVQWRSLDTTVATIDDRGNLLAKRPGVVNVQASLSGWRVATGDVVIRQPRVATLLDERWTGGIGAAWVPFGDPRPRMDSSADGTRAFMNNGEGSFISGAYTARRYPIGGGLTLDAWIADSITSDHWQIAAVVLDATLDEAGLARWSHRFGVLPRLADAGTCELVYPGGGEGEQFGDSLSIGLGRVWSTARVPVTFRAGYWQHVRVQLFPDGRCGIAVNGVALGVSEPRAIADSLARVVLFGNSAGTKVLVGPVSLRSGVATDIDWSRVGARVPNAPPAGTPMPGRP